MATWFPIGPDFVFTPRDANFRRLSRRNELARQGLVNSVAIDPNDVSTIYTAEAPTSGGNAAFRTDDGGNSWTSLVDSLQQTDPGNVNPSCVAHHPAISGAVYLGTFSGRVYTSTTRGSSWSGPFTLGGQVFKLIADPRNASDPATTVVYAASTSGLWRSADGGASFTPVIPGNVTALAARIPTDGSAADFYVGVSGLGIFYTNDPTGTWTNLDTLAGTNLPAFIPPTPAQPSGNFDAIRIDVCRANRRVYAWFFNTVCDATGANCNEGNAAPNTLFTTADPTGAWTAMAMTSPPGPSYGLYDSAFCVAANSPGDASSDILFFGGIHLYRSLDSGRTWLDTNSDEVHDDYHAFAFFPDPPPPGTVPAMYIGCDGGLAVATGFADPTFTPPGDFASGDPYVSSGAAQNLNHGKQSTAVYGYASDAAIAALGYVGVQDTGMNAGDSSLLWRGLDNADGGGIACKPGADGVKVWYTIDGNLNMVTDHGDFSPGYAGVAYGSGGPGVNGTSNFAGAPDGTCVGGINPRIATTVASVIASGTQTVAPASMAFIAGGRVLTVDPGGTTEETVTVTAVTATSFTAVFGQAHEPGVGIQLEIRQFGRVDQNAVATGLGPDLGLTPVRFVAVSPVDANLVSFATADQRLFLCTDALAASPVFNQIANGQPSNTTISSLTIDPGGNVYVMLERSVTSGSADVQDTGPLFLVTTSGWTQCSCTGLPADASNGTGYTRVVADPVQSNTLYAGHDARVFQLTSASAGAAFAWTDISTGLPGQWIYDLWICNLGTARSPKVLLRAAVPCRGIWEADVTGGATTPPAALYMRDNVLDMGWLPASPDGVPNPYHPVDALYHYMCADIKVDAQQTGSAGAFFQTDPEGTLPLSHVWFDQLRDNSDNLPGADQAMVHVQVRNRALTPLGNVSVWAIYSNAGAGLQALSKSPSSGDNFPFWSQFQATGEIVPALPPDSPWRSIGPPIVLGPIDVAHPQVASWQWTVPTLASGDPGHYCVVAFVHHSASPVNGSSYDVDAETPVNKQVGQKNLHIGPPLEAGGGGGGGAPGSGGGGSPRGGTGGRPMMREYIEFNNPTATMREATFLIRAKALPPELRLSFMLSQVQTVQPLPASITGVASPTGARSPGRQPGLDDPLLRILDRIEDEIEEIAEQLTACLKHWDRGAPSPGGTPGASVYTALPSTDVTITGVLLPPHGAAAMAFAVESRGPLPPGSRYNVHVQQVVGGRVVGGSAYVVRIAGESQRVVIPALGEEGLGWVPSYATDQIAAREESLGKS